MSKKDTDIAYQTRKKTFRVSGMTCGSCAERITRMLSDRDGVIRAEADYAKGTLALEWSPGVFDEEHLGSILGEGGYGLGSPGSTLTGIQFAAILLLAGAAFFIVRNTIGFNILPEVQATMGFAALFVVGLATSLHCVAMCGGLALSQCVAPAGEKEKPRSRRLPSMASLRSSLMYNGGRILSYTIIGGAAGALGAAVGFTGWARGVVALVTGILMMVMAVNLMGVLPGLRRWIPRLPASFREKAGRGISGKGPLAVGLLNGLMPCGPLQGMQLYALGTGSLALGAASMFFFSLGTVPLMLVLGSLASFLGARMSSVMMKISAGIILVLGLVMLDRGIALSGFAGF